MNSEIANRARMLRIASVPEWEEFLRNWTAYNAIFKHEAGGDSRAKIFNTVNHLSEEEAKEIIENLTDVISYFTTLPPGDMRKLKSDPKFRERSTQDMTIVNNNLTVANTRLSHLMGVVYQVRCNLDHADKEPDDERDTKLVNHSISVMNEFLPVLISAIDK